MLITEVNVSFKKPKTNQNQIKPTRKQKSIEIGNHLLQPLYSKTEFTSPINNNFAMTQRERKQNLQTEENELKIRNWLYTEMPDSRYDQQQDNLFSGQEARNQYYKSFRSINKISKEKKIPKVHANFLRELEKQSMYPEPIGIAQRKGNQFDINLNNYKIGDRLGTAFSKALPYIENLDMIQLKQNRLSDKIASKIVQKVSKNIKEIDLSYNQLSGQTIDKLCGLLNFYSLIQLQIEGCNLGDKKIKPLLEALQNNNTLQALNLAKNNLTDKCGEIFKQIVINNSTLRKVDLHYNFIRGQGAIQFLSGMIENIGIEELDLSWNSLGTTEKRVQISELIGQVLKQNKYLIHLDISNNLLDIQCCQIISDGLKENSVLLGLHINGNDAKIDHLGFMHPMKVNEQDLQHLSPRIFQKKKYVRQRIGGQNNCWICERWVEITFTWKPGISGQEEDEPAFIHLEIDDYEPSLMIKEKNGYFTYSRALPPGKIKYFYNFDGDLAIAYDQQKTELAFTLHKQNLLYKGKESYIQTEIVNILNVNFKDKLEMNLKPRPVKKI